MSAIWIGKEKEKEETEKTAKQMTRENIKIFYCVVYFFRNPEFHGYWLNLHNVLATTYMLCTLNIERDITPT